jgi:hypothetical protein
MVNSTKNGGAVKMRDLGLTTLCLIHIYLCFRIHQTLLRLSSQCIEEFVFEKQKKKNVDEEYPQQRRRRKLKTSSSGKCKILKY